MDRDHFPGHQQALLKNNIVIAVLSFSSHEEDLFQKTFSNFDYDNVINLCNYKRDAVLGSVWINGGFSVKPYESWILNYETYEWEPPTPRPDDGYDYFWNEDSKTWNIIEAETEE